MKLEKAGENTSQIEVTNISSHGIWIYIKSREYFLPFVEFPWYREAKIAEIMDVKLINGHHLFWEKLDIDLELASLADPQKYPLVYTL